MGGEIATVLASVKDSQINSSGIKWSNEEKNIFMNNIIKNLMKKDLYFATSRLWDDGVIDPLETRNILGNSLSFVKIKLLIKKILAFLECKKYMSFKNLKLDIQVKVL